MTVTGKGSVSTDAVRFGRATVTQAQLAALVAAVESMGFRVDIRVAYAGKDWCATAEVSQVGAVNNNREGQDR